MEDVQSRHSLSSSVCQPPRSPSRSHSSYLSGWRVPFGQEYWHLLALERQGEEDEGETEKPKEHTGNCSLGHLSHRNERLGSHENLCLNVRSCLTHKHPEAGPSRWAPQGAG